MEERCDGIVLCHVVAAVDDERRLGDGVDDGLDIPSPERAHTGELVWAVPIIV